MFTSRVVGQDGRGERYGQQGDVERNQGLSGGRSHSLCTLHHAAGVIQSSEGPGESGVEAGMGQERYGGGRARVSAEGGGWEDGGGSGSASGTPYDIPAREEGVAFFVEPLRSFVSSMASALGQGAVSVMGGVEGYKEGAGVLVGEGEEEGGVGLMAEGMQQGIERQQQPQQQQGARNGLEGLNEGHDRHKGDQQPFFAASVGTSGDPGSSSTHTPAPGAHQSSGGAPCVCDGKSPAQVAAVVGQMYGRGQHLRWMMGAACRRAEGFWTGPRSFFIYFCYFSDCLSGFFIHAGEVL